MSKNDSLPKSRGEKHNQAFHKRDNINPSVNLKDI